MVRIGGGNRVIYFVSGAFVVIAVALFLMVGPPQLLAKSSTPDFCVRCHVMESEYESWIHTGAHRRIKCVDCHLPNENVGLHYIWKSIDGMKDVIVFYSGFPPEHITISEHGQKVLQRNCVRCHETTVAHIDTERQCWQCHRRVSHTRSGAMETL
ncbi:cytochrome c nitrite reductase small subunit [Geobacter pickeringii]|uniref:Cytochrome C nitrite reductase n=1 Tax=Geobacter pickeringii TaxID=345632 RepID=A0A0B5B6X5_9BACT|nr:cytochrome c nitrite reductase small subunit [Geobacter pickeringii]AJE02292.1 cytochrome C nitrite reductase [Geobacter pickeringii]